MKEIFLLTKTLLKSSTNDSKKQVTKNKSSFGKFLLYIFVYGYIIGFMSYISYEAISALILINQPIIFFNIAFIGMLGFCIIQTIITSLNLLYFSKDLDTLLPLPITPIKIVIAKLNCLVISQYIILGLMLLPGIIIYGILLGLNVIYYVISISCLLIFPIIPVVMVAGLITIVMKFTKIIKNKEIVQYLSILITIFLIIALQGLNGNSTAPAGEELANNLVSANSSLGTLYSKLPNIKLILNTILNYNNIDGIKSLGLLIVFSIFIYYVIAFLISKVYVKTVININTVKSKKIRIDSINKEFKTSNIFSSYLKKEIKLLTRTPIFFMQCVLPSIIFPIIIGVPAIIGIKDAGMDLNLLRQDFGSIINDSFGIMGILVTILFMYIFNYASVTAISRDGENAVFMKYIPLDYKKQIFYKAFPGIILNLIPTIYVLIFIIVVIPRITLQTIFGIFLISQIINIFNNIVAILIDLKNPKLKWITEYAVVKQNFNMVFVLFITILEILIVVWLGNKINEVNNFIILLITLSLLSYVLVKKYINKNQEKIFEKIN